MNHATLSTSQTSTSIVQGMPTNTATNTATNMATRMAKRTTDASTRNSTQDSAQGFADQDQPYPRESRSAVSRARYNGLRGILVALIAFSAGSSFARTGERASSTLPSAGPGDYSGTAEQLSLYADFPTESPMLSSMAFPALSPTAFPMTYPLAFPISSPMALSAGGANGLLGLALAGRATVSQCGVQPPIISAGKEHTCAVTRAGVAKCWGNNDSRQVMGRSEMFNTKHGTSGSASVPTVVPGLSSNIRAISAGGEHTCAINSSGGVMCWGLNVDGSLGDGTKTKRETVVQVVGLTSGVRAISTGERHTCAINSSGGLVCWGANGSGQLGDGTEEDKPVPTRVPGLDSGVMAVAAGEKHTCALTTAGQVFCWGSNEDNQLGPPSASAKPYYKRRITYVPRPVVGLESGVCSIAAGEKSTCAITSGGDVLCWGQTGECPRTENLTRVPGLPSSGIMGITVGGQSACVRIANGQAMCWIINSGCSLSNGKPVNPRREATPVFGVDSSAVTITSGEKHVCAINAAGQALCWGRNHHNELGDGTDSDRHIATPVLNLQ